jgi:iron complex outermembrane receptor protein
MPSHTVSPRVPATRLRTLAIAMAACGVAPVAGAQAVETVVITATKRTGSIQDTPIAVSALSGTQLDDAGIKSSQELFGRIPSADITLNNGSTNANIYIRGIGTKGVGVNAVSAVGVYADEVSLNSPIVNVLQLFDLERVEVLRGPQNTLYGRNTTGGAVNYISARPQVGEGLNGKASVTLGSYSQRDIEAALGADLGGNSAVRLAMLAQRRDGVYDNLNLGEKVYNRDSTAGRLQWLWQPSKATNVLVKVHAEEVDQTNKLWKMIGLQRVAGNGAADATLACPVAQVGLGSSCVSRTGARSDPADTTSFSASLRAPIEKVSASGASFTLNQDIGSLKLTAITAYEANDYKKAEDIDAGPQTRGSFGFDFFQLSKAKQYSQELRLTSPADSPLRWIGGVFFFKENLVGNTTSVQYFRPDQRIFSTSLDQDNQVQSAYGEMEYDLSKEWTAIFGLRLTRETLDGNNTSVRRSLLDANTLAALGPITGQDPISTARLLATPFVQGTAGATGSNPYVNAPYKASWTKNGWKLGTKFQLDRDSMVFANVAEGFKAGSFSAAPATSIVAGTNLPNPAFFTPVNPESLLAVEAGWKTAFLDRKLRLGLTAYSYSYRDQQPVFAESVMVHWCTKPVTAFFVSYV